MIETFANTDISLKRKLEAFASQAINKKYAIALFQSPQSNEIKCMAGYIKRYRSNDLPSPSFAISNFDNKDFIWAIEPQLIQFQYDMLSQADFYIPDKEIEPFQKDNFINLVKDALEQIKNKHFEKVVVSRRKVVDLNHSFNLIDHFINLCQAYPNAFVSIISSKETGTWMGASPELLLQKKNDELLSVAIAGTRTKDQLSNDLDFNSKEIIEQEIVSKYLREIFAVHNLKVKESGTNLLNAGNLFHLQTKFSISSSNGKIRELLQSLHPTPATCGYPKHEAFKYIIDHEYSPRELYAGFLGPVYNTDDLELYVNLRCMQFLQDKAIFYAGAGIVRDSEPEKEFQETENKMYTLLNLL